MELNVANVLWVIGAGASLATAVFWGAFYLGRLTNRIDHAHDRLDEHDERLGELLARRRGDHHPAWDGHRT